MIGLLINTIKILFVLGFLITIHEGGHFIVAKLCKVRVNDFSIGFGPIIFKKKKNDTLYTLRLIPLGGFVKLEGEEEDSDAEDSFNKAPIMKRIAIVFAGAFVNIVFALIVYFVLVCYHGDFITTTVENTIDGYAAENYGIQANDKIVKINDKDIVFKSDIDEIISASKGEKVKVEIERNDERITLDVIPTKETTKNIGIYFGKQGEDLTTQIKYVYPNSPASNELKEGDFIKAINNIEVNNDPYEVVKLINESKDSVIVKISRDDNELEYTMIPLETEAYYLGVTLKKADNGLLSRFYYGVLDTVDFIRSIFQNLLMLFKGNISVDQMMGPIGISELVSKTNGLYDFIYLLALISLSLGITNLLPIVPLDGGKIVLLAFEGIRKKPLNKNIEIYLNTAGFLAFIALSIYVSYNDVVRIFIK